MNAINPDANLLTHFEVDGFVAIPQFMSGDDFAELLTNVDRFICGVAPTMPSEHVFYEDKSDASTLKQLQHMGDYDPWFQELFENGRFREVAERLLGGPVVPKNMQYFNKPPGVGQPTPPHQDGFYFMLEPCEAVTMWFALESVDEETGCVRYVPGSHKRGMREHARTETLGFSQGITDYPTVDDRRREVAMPAQTGDLLVHHALTIHRADGNSSTDRTRRALGFIYYSERARENEAAHEAYQQQLTADLAAARKI
ncbi:MAG: phytanoyl-CoA dioxygenase family protein [Pirellulales bacterium]|nr:phytanoyl-CoA dioxygenase family protein [Pirellulales bacterium]